VIRVRRGEILVEGEVEELVAARRGEPNRVTPSPSQVVQEILGVQRMVKETGPLSCLVFENTYARLDFSLAYRLLIPRKLTGPYHPNPGEAFEHAPR